MSEYQTKLENGDKGDEIRERPRPEYVAKMRTEDGKWLRVGCAYFNPRTESFTIYFSVIPHTCKVVLFKD